MKVKAKFLLKIAIIVLAIVGVCYLVSDYGDNIRDGKTTVQRWFE